MLCSHEEVPQVPNFVDNVNAPPVSLNVLPALWPNFACIFYTHTIRHTLILSGDDHWPIYGFLSVELSYLMLIATQSVGFCDVSEGNLPNTQNGAKWSLWEHFPTLGPTWVH